MEKKFYNERGFTLIEVLVAVFLLAIGLMSAASMQTTAISSNKFAKDTTVALQLAEEMMDRIRVNSGNLPELYHGINTGTNYCPLDSAHPNPNLDCKQWTVRLTDRQNGLINPIGYVRVQGKLPYTGEDGVPVDYAATVTVTVEWGSKWAVRKRRVSLTTIIETWVS